MHKVLKNGIERAVSDSELARFLENGYKIIPPPEKFSGKDEEKIKKAK